MVVRREEGKRVKKIFRDQVRRTGIEGGHRELPGSCAEARVANVPSTVRAQVKRRSLCWCLQGRKENSQCPVLASYQIQALDRVVAPQVVASLWKV